MHLQTHCGYCCRAAAVAAIIAGLWLAMLPFLQPRPPFEQPPAKADHCRGRQQCEPTAEQRHDHCVPAAPTGCLPRPEACQAAAGRRQLS